MNKISANYEVLLKGWYKHNVNGGGEDGDNSKDSEDNWVRNSMTDDGWVRGFCTHSTPYFSVYLKWLSPIQDHQLQNPYRLSLENSC